MHQSYTFNNLKGVISQYKGVVHCEGFDYEEISSDSLETPFSNTFFTRRIEMPSRPGGFMFYVNLGVDFFSTTELLYPKSKVRLQLMRARSYFYMVSEYLNISHGIVGHSL